jgi:hypothetical protein
MAFIYSKAVPWGRSFEEYVRMFALSDEDLRKSILGCADGPASFNAGMAGRGRRVISCDPIYELTASKIKERIDATYDDVIAQTRQNQDRFVWDRIGSVEDLGRIRLKAMNDFLEDYGRGMPEGRYVAAELPELPFAAGTFDLALCSHLLFLYSDILPFSFHEQAIDDLLRVAREVRIFPLLTYNGDACEFVEPIADHLSRAGRTVSVEQVPYEFQRGGNKMMRIV